ncbi:MAG: hypothetical protein D6768_09405 [Chloroflexi bacterium]|nr:MAG: hypothetical protein D6768_09405 [Chloroflexota bacterium]
MAHIIQLLDGAVYIISQSMFLLVLALGILIVNSRNSQQHIDGYNRQTLVMFGIAQLLILFRPNNPTLALVALFPLIRFVVVRSLLAYATTAEPPVTSSLPVRGRQRTTSGPVIVLPFNFPLWLTTRTLLPIVTLTLIECGLLAILPGDGPLIPAAVIAPFTLILAWAAFFARQKLENTPGISNWLARARSHWLEHGRSRYGSRFTGFASFALVIGAFLLTQQVTLVPLGERSYFIGLFTALALVFTGMFMMVNEADIISHMVGLLVAENGLLLVAVVVVEDNVPLTFIVAVSIFVYIIATVVILIYFIKNLQRRPGDLNIRAHRRLGG